MKIDTLPAVDLDRMMDFELVCQWCEAPAEYMWRHDTTVHFNCGQCAEENQDLNEEMMWEGRTDCYCVGCRRVIDLLSIKFVKI